ncbi:MAG TPA: RelA/SpoT family protein [Candidatus Absconditabacterales bacterium]|nr:RelA/SpoT family protein [Candidatus Absconditabacterales bacterium]
MDINKLDNFLDYKVDLSIKPQDLVDEVIHKAKKYLGNKCIEPIKKAYEFADKAHKGEKRLSGEPYIMHPIRATIILMDLKPDIESIQTCLLHDVIEDTPITEEEIKIEFGEEVCNLCNGLVKVSKIKYKGEDRHLETIKKTFLAMAKDLRVIFIKLADRIHNMQTLQFHPEKSKKTNIANETMKIYVPIAKRLGLYHYQVTLENACFKVLTPDMFKKITGHLKKNFSMSEKYIKRGTETIGKLLQKEGLEEFQVKGRIKSPYRIREKMEQRYKTKDISSVMDLLAFRVITNNIPNCYQTLGIIHKHYTPLIKKIKDYIAVPKFNGYKSIHTTILGMFRFPIEIQIRTNEMDDIAEYGVAAHYAYSDRSSPKQISKKQAEWMEKLQKLVNAYTESESKDQFKDKLDIEILNKETFIYTPKGDIIEVPKGSTVLDFAFHVHTEIGLRFKNAIVNGEIVPITHVPNTGDIVRINTFRYKYTANKHRASIVKTPSAKNKILKFTKQEKRNELLELSTNTLNKKLKEIGIISINSNENKINKIYGKKELEGKLIDAIEQKSIYNNIIKSAYPETYKKHFKKASSHKPKEKEKNKTINIIIDEDKILNYHLCPECNPSYPEKIIAKTGKNGIKIHNLRCRSMKTISPGKLLEAHRQGQEKNIYKVTSIVSVDLKLNLIELLGLFDKLNIEVKNFSIKDDEKSDRKIVKITREVNNPGQIGMLNKHTKEYGKMIKTLRRIIE